MEEFKIKNNFFSIRTRILMFSIFAALAPSIGMGWMINSMMYAAIADKTEQKLLDSFSIIDREISLWFKERSYDLRVFSNSFVITESFNKYLGGADFGHPDDAKEPTHIKNIVTYLSSVQNQFPNYFRLAILDKQGETVASSDTGEKSRSIQLPVDALSQIDSTGYFKGEVIFEGPNNDPLILIGVPIFSDKHEENMWILAGEVHLGDILTILQANLFNIKTALPICGSIVRLKDG
ncbi:MAG: GGDEF domain-containing protein, partial [Desulfobulbaceae bacterium]|nr:GGDEF domain-containing protein [Desulfobulbaceae bacterium]